MLRNDLIIWMGEKENADVFAAIGDVLIAVDSVTERRDGIVLVLAPDDLEKALQAMTPPEEGVRS